MQDLPGKTIAQSLTYQVQMIMPAHINGYNRLFGGKLMEWIDIVAGVVARRHSNSNITTVYVDNLQFKAAVYVNDTIVLRGKITYVGHTSMEVRVDTFSEALSGERTLVNQAYLVMVALGYKDRPTPVPPLILETEEEKQEWEAAKKRYNLRKTRRIEDY